MAKRDEQIQHGPPTEEEVYEALGLQRGERKEKVLGPRDERFTPSIQQTSVSEHKKLIRGLVKAVCYLAYTGGAVMLVGYLLVEVGGPTLTGYCLMPLLAVGVGIGAFLMKDRFTRFVEDLLSEI